MSRLTSEEAWKILEVDSKTVFQHLSATPNNLKIMVADKQLKLARKLARNLSALNHPDTGGNPKKFILIQSALSSLEFHIENFKKRMEKLLEDEETKISKKSVFIRVGL